MKKTVIYLAVMLLIFSVFWQNFTAVVAESPYQIQEENIDTSILKKLSAVKAKDIEELIRVAEEELERQLSEELQKKQIAETLLNLKNGKISLRKVFADTCFAGDSLINGLEVYNILNKEKLMTQISARLSHLEESINKIVSANPKVLILHYGLNMLWTDETGTQWFIDDYRELVLKLKKALPHTRIIISGIFPVDKEVAQDEIFTHIPRHNEALKKMCADLGVEFLDSTALVNSSKEYYSTDGIHLIGSFYSEKWLPFIVENKGITG